MNRLRSLCNRLRRQVGIFCVVCKYGRGDYSILWRPDFRKPLRSVHRSSLRECEEFILTLWR